MLGPPFVWWDIDAISRAEAFGHDPDLLWAVEDHRAPGQAQQWLHLLEDVLGEVVVVGRVEALRAHRHDVVNAARERTAWRGSSGWGTNMLRTPSKKKPNWTLPAEQRMLDGFQVDKSVVLFDEFKDFHLAFVLRVIDNEEVDGIVWKL